MIATLAFLLLQQFDDPNSDPNALPWVADGLKISIYAKEPLVRNPAALAFDARGRLFAGGGPQYRHPRPETPGDSIWMLIDSDGDGTADRAKTFATGFNSVQGLAWKGRDLWVANAPDLTIVRDLDGDDEADEYVLVATGLATLEHGLHGLTWAPDGRLYMSKGDTPVQPWAPKAFRALCHVGEEAPPPVPLKVYKKGEYRKTYVVPMDGHTEGGVLRCNPDGTGFEIIARGLRNPWDIAFDDGFNWLGTDNDDVGGDRIFMPFFGAHFGSRHPWSNSWTGENHLPTVPISGPTFEGSGVGIVYYTAPHFPEPYRNSFLIGDWHQKKIYVYRPTWKGALRLEAAGELQELVRGGKSLFRPTDMEVAPDGSLFVGGWGSTYGAKTKGKEFISEGRVYRITAARNPPPPAPKRAKPYGQWTFEELLEDLGSHFPVWRVEAQEEIVRRGAALTGDLLRALDSGTLTESQETWSIWALGRGPAFPSRNASILNQRVQTIRIHAFRKEVSASMVDLIKDPEPRIRLEAAIALRQARKGEALKHIQEALVSERDRVCYFQLWGAMKALADLNVRRQMLQDVRPAVRLGALLGLLEEAALKGEEVLALSKDPDSRVAGLAAQWLGKVGYGLADPGAVLAQLQKLDHRHVNYELRLNLLRTLSRMQINREQWNQLHQSFYVAWRKRSDEVVPEEKALEVAEALSILAGDPRAVPVLWDALDHDWPPVRTAAAEIFPRCKSEARSFILDRLQEAKGRRLEGAVQALKGFDRAPWTPRDPAVKALAMAYDLSNDPVARLTILDLLASAEPWRETSAAEKVARKAAADPDPRVHGAVAALASKLGVAIEVTAVRREPATIESVLALLPKANAANGAALFRSKGANCLACHRVDGEGRAIAPDVSDIGARQDGRAIVESILKPSATIIEGFRVTRIKTRDGGVLDGLVHDETDVSLKLYQTDGRDLVLAKKDIELRKVSEISLMPEGFDRILSAPEIADITAWLLSLKKPRSGGHVLKAGGRHVATFHTADKGVLRPFFSDLRAADGTSLTRTFPPVDGRDATDHATMHPGVWLGFGDMGGSDFWRNKGRVEHVRFVGEPKEDGFTHVSRFLADGRTVCIQTLRVDVRPIAGEILLVLDAAFRSTDGDFTFGDQEEMGLGVRMATSLTVKTGGRMTDSEGRSNEKQIWGKPAAWCDTSGTVDGRRLGITVIPDPSNFRSCWWHVRDYGVMVANPFGRSAMKQGAPSSVAVKKGETFRLRFGLLLHSNPAGDSFDLRNAAMECTKAMQSLPRPETAE